MHGQREQHAQTKHACIIADWNHGACGTSDMIDSVWLRDTRCEGWVGGWRVERAHTNHPSTQRSRRGQADDRGIQENNVYVCVPCVTSPPSNGLYHRDPTACLCGTCPSSLQMAGFRRRVLRPLRPLWQHQQRHRHACVLTTCWTDTHEVVTQPTFTHSIVRQPHVATHVTHPTPHSIQRAPMRRQDDRAAAQSCGCEEALKNPGQALVAPSPSSTVHVADVGQVPTARPHNSSRAQLPAPPTARSLFYMRACSRAVWVCLRQHVPQPPMDL
jgi:hypothetical protein